MNMLQAPKSKLRELMALPAETEWVEFKEAKNNFDFDDLGRYFSALSNEANLAGQSGGWLFPVEISQYDAWVIRESLHNCIAHQDYRLNGRVNVVEEPDAILFTNLGDFLPGSVEEVILKDAPPEFYRNRFLAEAMVNLNMIDTIGSGIKRMFTQQRQRNFPMPDYDLSEPGKVKVRIIGKIMDERYTRMLMQRTDLGLLEVIALDKVLNI